MKEINDIFNNYFGLIEDKRNENKIRYTLADILKILIIGVLCGLDKVTEIVDYAKDKKEFLLKEFGIKKVASHSTVERVLSMINTEFLSLILYKINKEYIKNNFEEIHFDGKVIRATEMITKFNKALNIVTAYTETGISLYQETVYEKTNEIPTVQSMLEIIDIKGKIITADALHCQKETARAIVENGGEYLIQLKSNQKNIYEDFKIIYEEEQLTKKILKYMKQ